jgi:hypothetical protein
LMEFFQGCGLKTRVACADKDFVRIQIIGEYPVFESS